MIIFFTLIITGVAFRIWAVKQIMKDEELCKLYSQRHVPYI